MTGQDLLDRLARLTPEERALPLYVSGALGDHARPLTHLNVQLGSSGDPDEQDDQGEDLGEHLHLYAGAPDPSRTP